MTRKENMLQVLSDLEFHCPHEFNDPNQYASTVKGLRNDGYSFYVNESGSLWAKNIFCMKCGKKTAHRKLLSLEKTDTVTNRVGFTKDIKQRVLKMFDGRDVLTGGTDRLEIDHRVTSNRVKGGELPLPENFTDYDLKSRYMILTRINNQIKREACKKCINTGKRQPSLTGVSYFYEGNEDYIDTCNGCFWAYPEKWVTSLNERIKGN